MDPNMSAIDPGLLQDMINATKKDSQTLVALTQRFRTRFSALGLTSSGFPNAPAWHAPMSGGPATSGSGGPFGQLTSIHAWIEDELPHLKRRQRLAAALQREAPTKNGLSYVNEKWVSGEAAAIHDGKELAGKFRKQLEDSGDVVPESLMTELKNHSYDPDFVKSFYKSLGPQRLSSLSLRLGTDQGLDPAKLKEYRATLSDSFRDFTTTAFESESSADKHKDWTRWLKSFNPDGADAVAPSLNLLTPILKGGKQDKDFLIAMGDEAASSGVVGPGGSMWPSGSQGAWGKDPYAQLLAATSTVPAAAGAWMDHHHELAQEFTYGTGKAGKSEGADRANAYAAVLHASTVELKHTDPKLASKVTARVLFDNAHKTKDLAGLHAVAPVQRTYSEIVAGNWNDLLYSVTSPTGDLYWDGSSDGTFGTKKYKWDYKSFLNSQDPKHRGPAVKSGLWESLLKESMRNPTAAGHLSAMFDTYDQRSTERIAALVGHDNDQVRNVKHFLEQRRLLMSQIYSDSYSAALDGVKVDAEDWAARVNASRTSLINTAISAAQAGGAGAPAAAIAGLTGTSGVEEGGDSGEGGDGGVAGKLKDFGIEQGKEAAIGQLTDGLTSAVSVKPEDNSDIKGLYKNLDGRKADLGFDDWHKDYRRKIRGALTDAQNSPTGPINERLIPPVEIGPINGHMTRSDGNPDKYGKPGSPSSFLDANGAIVSDDELQKHPAKLAAYTKWVQSYAMVNKIVDDGYEIRLPDDSHPSD